MHLEKIALYPEKYPTREEYPFNLKVFRHTREINFQTPVTFFIGENGTGKSTLLKAIARKCNIKIWQSTQRTRFKKSPHEGSLHTALGAEWVDGSVPGSFFSSQIFQNFSEILDEWASTDPGLLAYFGGESLMKLSHGQSLMSFFKSRYKIKGLYLLDEPETALSPGSQLELLHLLKEMTTAGHAQFIIASHSPILLAYPEAVILNFDNTEVTPVSYEETEYYQVYKDFLVNREKYLKGL
jgi:predicted ATPase